MNATTFFRIFAIVLGLLVSSGASGAGINKGFYKKAAKKVWAMDSEGLFDPSTAIADSIAEGQSAVVIARQDDFVGKRIENNSIYTASGRTNRTHLEHTERSMVKLLDESALEDYGTFEFGGDSDKPVYGFYQTYAVDQTFGARVHKPDGSVVEVDVTEALEMSDGKKGDKNKRYKIAIPGLEKGDVLEYFYYTEYDNDDDDVELVDVMLTDRHPVLGRLLTGSFDPTLTIEFKSYNGAPVPEPGKAGNNNTARMFCANLPAIDTRSFLFEERQLPFVRLNTINNHDVAGTFTQRAKNSRGAGIYFNISGTKIQRESMEHLVSLANYLYKRTKPISDIPRKATNMVKDYAKTHPDADPRLLADVAFLAVRYQNLTAKPEDTWRGSLPLTLFHNEVMENLKAYPLEQTGIAYANGRDEVSIDDMAKWNQATYLSMVDGVPYYLNAPYYYSPQELPAVLQDVPAVVIMGRLRDHNYISDYERTTLPDRKAMGNMATFRTGVSVDPDAPERLHLSRDVSLKGSAKADAADFTDYMEWIGAVEDFFDIPAGKRYSDKTYSADDRRTDLNAALRQECRENVGVEVDTVLKFEITSRGLTPDSPEMTYTMECEASDLVEDLGDALNVRVGKLSGNHRRVAEHERDRMFDALLPSANTEIHIITLKVPQGYAVDETSLQSLGRQVVNSVGQFIVQPGVNEDGDVEIQCVQRVRYHSVAHQAWPMLLELLDASAEFADASLILSRK